MLKHKRKLNKLSLIVASLAYGQCRIDVSKYRAFHQLAGFHGPVLAARMVSDALTRFPENADRTGCSILGFVVWSQTGYMAEWTGAYFGIPR